MRRIYDVRFNYTINHGNSIHWLVETDLRCPMALGINYLIRLTLYNKGILLMNANKNYIRSISWGHLAYPAGVILLKFEIFQSVSNGLLGRIKPARCPGPTGRGSNFPNFFDSPTITRSDPNRSNFSRILSQGEKWQSLHF